MIVTAYYPPKPSVGAYRMEAFARAFRRHGWRCTVVAPSFGLREKKVADTVRIGSGALPNHPSFAVRFLIETWVSLRLLWAARGLSADVRLVTSPYLACLVAAPLLLSRTGLAFDVRDLTWTYPMRSGVSFRWAQLILRRCALWALRRAELVLVTTTAQADSLEDTLPADRILLVPNGVEQHVLERLSKQVRHAGRSTRLMYAGALGHAQGISILADLARLAPDLEIDIFGTGVEWPAIDLSAAATPNLRLHGHLPRESVLEAYSTASILFLRLRPGFETAVPSKLYEYAAAGLPIIFMGPDGACWREMSRLGGTCRVEDGDVHGLLVAVKAMSGRQAQQAAVNWRIAQACWSREATAARLVGELSGRLGIA